MVFFKFTINTQNTSIFSLALNMMWHNISSKNNLYVLFFLFCADLCYLLKCRTPFLWHIVSSHLYWCPVFEISLPWKSEHYGTLLCCYFTHFWLHLHKVVLSSKTPISQRAPFHCSILNYHSLSSFSILATSFLNSLLSWAIFLASLNAMQPRFFFFGFEFMLFDSCLRLDSWETKFRLS